MKTNLFLVSLGCDKNKVDSLKILDFFVANKNMHIVNDIYDADVVIINTCSFIYDAKKESINIIKKIYQLKKQNIIKKIYVFGCLAKEYKIFNDKKLKYQIDLKKYADEIYYYDDYLEKIASTYKRQIEFLSYSSSIKISDGCNKKCAYCIIPYLRGKNRSSSIENLYKESLLLSKNGTKELNIVAQDTLNYGIDIYNKKMIIPLLDKISSINKIKWIRLLYCYPESIDDDLIDFIKNNKKIINYIDMPIQHINDQILKMMNRPTTKNKIMKLIDKLRNNIPDICIRTTFMVGFPNETDEMFNELLDFIKDIKFDKVGAFKYSNEFLSKSYSFDNQIEEKIKNDRLKLIFKTQYKVVLEKNKNEINKIYEVIVDGFDTNKKMYIGRNYKNAKDIDNLIYFKSKDQILTGQFKKIKIVKTDKYDLIGEINEN